MGAKVSTLPAEDVAELANYTHFSPDQIQKLYQRFTRLDKDSSGTLSADEFLAIPEFAMNPLAQRILVAFQNSAEYSMSDSFNPTLSPTSNAPNILPSSLRRKSSLFANGGKEVDFGTFISTLSVFSPEASLGEKLSFAFQVFDLNQDGFISPNELFQVLKLMVGENLGDGDLQLIVDKTIRCADVKDRDGSISFQEFSALLAGKDLKSKMSVSF